MVAYTNPQQRKKKARRSINCMFLGYMTIRGIVFVEWVVKLGKGENGFLHKRDSFWTTSIPGKSKSS